jgi:predicted AlkP superfamily pyrophosphatase or phosphodiesterase
MKASLRALIVVLLGLVFAVPALPSAYNGHPKLVVVIVIDQFRGDYLERYREQFGEGGFRLLMDHGAYFSDCYYNYANTMTAPGHSTLFTGTYADGHGILANEWWDPQKKRNVTSVQDDNTRLVGISGDVVGASPRNLLVGTLGDELRNGTQGKARVFAVSLKDRASVLPGGFAANGAYWIDQKSGQWITSSYYRSDLPKWAQDFNDNKRGDKYLNREWKDADGNVLRTTKPDPSKATEFYSVVGSTPFANDYEFEFARELVTYEKLGTGPATDLLTISLSANDILGHQVGPDAPEMQAMALALDKQLADFFAFLGHQIGLANVWIALSADHGVAPTAAAAGKIHLGANLDAEHVKAEVNKALSARFPSSHPASYVREVGYPLVWLNEETFAAAHVKEEDAERATLEALREAGVRAMYTKSQLANGEAPNTEVGLRYEHSYSAVGGWYVFAAPPPYAVESAHGTDHISPYSYDRHVPLAFYGVPFQPGTYHTHAEPVDLAVTLASLLGINAPSGATGRVLNEALAPVHHGEGTEHTPDRKGPASSPSAKIQPAVLHAQGTRR